MKAFKIRRTAQLAAAYAIPADDLGLVANTDLFQFDPDTKNPRQIFDQTAEIHPAFGNEKENNLAAIEGIFGLDHLHIERAFIDLPEAIAHRVFGLDTIIFNLFKISVGRFAQDLS